ncbi:hypothetical protein LOZ61_003225 [Ophidiomyces ophidiicola]|nr:hypothetical protein LOZ61_003225 [Ophidiomyces ophidiicola]KAI1927552.1 hypothetical protein LOZ60_003007 [Ophidiomyces ophidiicola]KAI1959226.1 hypothetical protein LOZ59_003146 [Ophidiomyces ophidiicola]KAI2037959.1 hypothetical protein LOZ48_000187 [Ophidiomyces ophidiicola]KAI2145597.1 hypothetical protein LOZ27_003224 [Ophidiomyces ophidiicola]
MSDDGVSSTSQSQLLSTSTLPQSRASSKQIQQIYKQASQLFLTRRLQEALSVIEPLITASSDLAKQENTNGTSVETGPFAPIAMVPSTLRIKVWNLYITLLSSIVDLGPEEGKKEIGQKEWKSLASRVRDGEVWEDVVQVGYKGREGSVDADVVYNLATLLLNHSPTQTLNQERLENYLASYGRPELNFDFIEDSSPTKRKRRIASSRGADTPKDLTIRVRLLELFTLHILPRNDEWDYAKEFINLSEVLDDERKETFLQTLDNLQQNKEQDAQRAAELQKEKEEELERQRRRQEEEEEEEAKRKLEEQQRQKEVQQQKRGAEVQATSDSTVNGHTRIASEVDYGIEHTNPNSHLKTPRGTKPAIKSYSRSPEPSKRSKKKEQSKPGALRQVQHLSSLLITLLKRMIKSMSSSPMFLLRVVLVVTGIIMALGRPDIRERIRRVTGSGWQKIRGTVGMGVKVSYI